MAVNTMLCWQPTLAAGIGQMLASSPPVLFFFLGMFAMLVRSNLRIPRAVTKLLSLYLLWSIGFQGGVKLATEGLNAQAGLGLGAAMLLAVVVPVYTFFILRTRLAAADAAAVCACYGSVSAVTFMTATQWLTAQGTAFGGHMVAAMALMESPAIVIGVLMMRLSERRATTTEGVPPAKPLSWGTLLHEAFLNGPVLLMLGSMVIGVLTREKGYQAFKPLCTDVFSGVLVFFLLDLGLLAAKRLGTFRGRGVFLIGFALVVPLVNAAAAIALAKGLGLAEGDAILLAVLAASASYIAVPAAVRIAIPQADASIYIPMTLAITFPFNIAIGIPLYASVVRAWW